MTINKLLVAAAISLSLFGAKVAQAAEFFVIPGTQTLLVLGVTQASDVSTIQSHIRDDDIDTLILRGPGGDLEAAFAISDLVLKNQLDTVVPDDTDCASACAIIFVAGRMRELGNGARLGFHLPFVAFGRGARYNEGPNAREFCNAIGSDTFKEGGYQTHEFGPCLTLTYQTGLRDIRRLEKLFNRDGISEEVMDLMIETLPSDMTWVSHQDGTDEDSYFLRSQDGRWVQTQAPKSKSKAIQLGLHNAAE